MLTDISTYNVKFQGHPVRVIGTPVIERFPEFALGPSVLTEVLSRMIDTAKPGEPTGELYAATYGDRKLWLSPSGDWYDADTGHYENQFWTLYFPEDR